jgi:polar amino acid transport system substrate-binding protein
MKSGSLLAVTATLALGAAGCGLVVREPEVPPSEDSPTPDEHSPLAVEPLDPERLAPGVTSDYWDKIRAGGPLVVGVSTSYPPFGVGTTDPDHPVAGFDFDLAEHLSRTLGVDVEFKDVQVAKVMDALNDGEIDIAICGMTQTAYRAGQVNFTAPYLTISQAALVDRRLTEDVRRTDEEQRGNVRSYLDLAKITGIKIGVTRGTRPHRLALRYFPDAEVVAYDNVREVSEALIGGEVDSLVHDDPYVRVWAALNSAHSGRFTALLEPVTEEPISMAIRKGDLEFLTWLNAYVAEVRADGTTDRLYRRNFVDTVWLADAPRGTTEGGAE